MLHRMINYSMSLSRIAFGRRLKKLVNERQRSHEVEDVA